MSESATEVLHAAVLAALAGVRLGDAVADAGGPQRARRALQGASGGHALVATGADVVLAGQEDALVAEGVTRLAVGGRLVALAADRDAASRTAARHGLALRHVEPVPDGVAWSATLPHEDAP